MCKIIYNVLRRFGVKTSDVTTRYWAQVPTEEHIYVTAVTNAVQELFTRAFLLAFSSQKFQKSDIDVITLYSPTPHTGAVPV